jgi:hypothetical protein
MVQGQGYYGFTLTLVTDEEAERVKTLSLETEGTESGDITCDVAVLECEVVDGRHTFQVDTGAGPEEAKLLTELLRK